MKKKVVKKVFVCPKCGCTKLLLITTYSCLRSIDIDDNGKVLFGLPRVDIIERLTGFDDLGEKPSMWCDNVDYDLSIEGKPVKTVEELKRYIELYGIDVDSDGKPIGDVKIERKEFVHIVKAQENNVQQKNRCVQKQ